MTNVDLSLFNESMNPRATIDEEKFLIATGLEKLSQNCPHYYPATLVYLAYNMDRGNVVPRTRNPLSEIVACPDKYKALRVLVYSSGRFDPLPIHQYCLGELTL